MVKFKPFEPNPFKRMMILKIFGHEFKPGHCARCLSEIHPGEFEDDLSVTEHAVSGLCQKCQNSSFNEDN